MHIQSAAPVLRSLPVRRGVGVSAVTGGAEFSELELALSTAATSASSLYAGFLAAAPLPTAAITASSLAVAGDLLAQQRATPDEPLDMRRTAAFAIFGACYTGIFQYNLFALLIETCDGTTLLHVLNDGQMVVNDLWDATRGIAPYSTPEQFAVSPALDSAMLPTLGALERTLLNQLLVIPVLYYSLFFVVTGVAYELTPAASLERARSLWIPLVMRNLLFWLPVQFYQFSSIEPELQLPFVCVAGLVWNIILSAVGGSRPPSATQAVATDAARAADKRRERSR